MCKITNFIWDDRVFGLIVINIFINRLPTGLFHLSLRCVCCRR